MIDLRMARLGGWARLVGCCLLLGAGAAHAENRAGLGLNLSGWLYFSPTWTVLDEFKRSSGWLTQCDKKIHPQCEDFAKGGNAFNTREQDQLDLDENGWLKSLPADGEKNRKFRTVAVAILMGGQDDLTNGRYIVTYEGRATLGYAMAARKVDGESRPGRDVVEVSGNRDRPFLIQVQEVDPKNYLKNIQVVRAGGFCAQAPERVVPNDKACNAKTGGYRSFEALARSELWHPKLLKDLEGFRALRFLNWTNTNASMLVEWAQRPKMSQPSWDGPDGLPYEALFDLAKVTQADPWINLPISINDAFATEFGKLARRSLAPGAVLHLELGNEPWNFGFKPSHWIRKQGVAKWPKAKEAGATDLELAANWYGWRAATVCRLVKQAFESADRVRCIAGGHAANPWYADKVLGCSVAAAELGSSCAKRLDALAIAPYFGHYISDPRSREVVSNWYKEADGGLDKLFQEITGTDAKGQPVKPPLAGVHPQSIDGGALASARKTMVEARAVADRHGLPLLAYEGGQHLVARPKDDDKQWVELFTRANRDRRMGLAYTRHLTDWREAGGQAYMAFSYVGRTSAHGAWGLKETTLDEQHPKWLAVQAFRREQPCWWTGCSR